jgi:hypothetical protein
VAVYQIHITVEIEADSVEEARAEGRGLERVVRDVPDVIDAYQAAEPDLLG